MRFPRKLLAVVVLVLAACGAGADPFDAPPDSQPIPGNSRELRLVASARFVQPHDLRLQDRRPQGRALSDVVDRLYFIASTTAPAPSERIDLHVRGTEGVLVGSIRIVDDSTSPFGLGAADHFEVTAPAERSIAPGGTLPLSVSFKGDTMEMQNAFLEVRTNAENTPLIRVAMTGKVFRTP